MKSLLATAQSKGSFSTRTHNILDGNNLVLDKAGFSIVSGTCDATEHPMLAADPA